MISSVYVDLQRWVYNNNQQELRIKVIVDGKEYTLNHDMQPDDFTTNFDYIFDTMKNILKESIKADIDD